MRFLVTILSLFLVGCCSPEKKPAPVAFAKDIRLKSMVADYLSTRSSLRAMESRMPPIAETNSLDYKIARRELLYEQKLLERVEQEILYYVTAGVLESLKNSATPSSATNQSPSHAAER